MRINCFRYGRSQPLLWMNIEEFVATNGYSFLICSLRRFSRRRWEARYSSLSRAFSARLFSSICQPAIARLVASCIFLSNCPDLYSSWKICEPTRVGFGPTMITMPLNRSDVRLSIIVSNSASIPLFINSSTNAKAASCSGDLSLETNQSQSLMLVEHKPTVTPSCSALTVRVFSLMRQPAPCKTHASWKPKFMDSGPTIIATRIPENRDKCEAGPEISIRLGEVRASSSSFAFRSSSTLPERNTFVASSMAARSFASPASLLASPASLFSFDDSHSENGRHINSPAIPKIKTTSNFFFSFCLCHSTSMRSLGLSGIRMRPSQGNSPQTPAKTISVKMMSNQPHRGMNDTDKTSKENADAIILGTRVVAICSWITGAALIVLGFLTIADCEFKACRIQNAVQPHIAVFSPFATKSNAFRTRPRGLLT